MSLNATVHISLVACGIMIGIAIGLLTSSIGPGITAGIISYLVFHSMVNCLDPYMGTFNPLARFKRKTKRVSVAKEKKKEYWRWEYDRNKGGEN
ncbi:MAG: hypothetical protein AAB575_02220 [Patescibacteria group bacterium]